MTIVAHLARALAMLVVFPDVIAAVLRLYTAGSLLIQTQWSQAQISYEDAVDLIVLFLMSCGAVAAFRLCQKSLALSAILILVGFIWFAGAPQGGQAAIRLIYPAVAGFLGLGILGQMSKLFYKVVLAIFSVCLALDQAFLVAGYWVV